MMKLVFLAFLFLELCIKENSSSAPPNEPLRPCTSYVLDCLKWKGCRGAPFHDKTAICYPAFGTGSL